MMIVEYCPFGSLEKYLRTNRSKFMERIDTQTKMIKDSIRKQRDHTDASAEDNDAPKAQRDRPQG